MQQAVHENGPERDLDLLIEKGFLLLGSIEFQIDEHLMSHGTRISPETRFFMAQVRDAAGDAATKLLDEARNRLDTGPADAAGEPADAADPVAAEAGFGESACTPLLPALNGSSRTPAMLTRGPRFAFGRAAVSATFGAASAALVVAMLAAGQTPSDAPAQALGPIAEFAANDAVEAPAASTAATRAGEAVAAEWLASVTLRASGDPRGRREPVADRAAEVLAAADQPEAHPIYPYLRAVVADEARPEIADRWPLSEEFAALDLRPGEPGDHPPYPDPRAGPAQSAPIGPKAAAAAEARLALSIRDRREIQRRLALARFDPHSVDGVFGPVTRASLGEWQSASGLPATGYLDGAALALLRDRTADAYRAMQAKKAGARRQAARTVLTSPVPPVSPVRADGCSRTRSGKILYGQGMRCDFRGLRQNIAGLFG